MKSYNEMAQAVFERRDEFVAHRKKQRATLLKAGASLCSLVLVCLVGVVFLQNRPPEIPTVPTTPTVNTENTDNADNTKNTDYLQITDSTEPIESDPENTIGEQDNPQYVPDRTEATSAVDGSVDDVPSCSPGDKPQTGTVPGSESDWVPGFPQDSTEAPPTGPDETEPMGTMPTEPIEVKPTEPTMGEWLPDSTDATEPTGSVEVLPTDPTEPTVEATGPLTINVGSKQYVAEVGDVVTYTAELYVKDHFETFQAGILHDSKLEVIEIVNPNEDDPAPVHFPSLTGGSEMMNYHRDRSREAEKEIFVTATRLAGYRFREQRVLFTFDFVVKKPGETTIALCIEELIAKGGEPEYFLGGRQLIFENINIEEYLTITPAEEVVIPTAPKEEPQEAVPPFTYPAQSFDGEAQIVCDGRTYSADAGQRVTYVVELEVEDKFDSVQLMIKHDSGLEAYEPNETDEVVAEDVALPNLGGTSILNYNKEYTANGQTYPAVRLDASTVRAYDFRRRKVLLQVDFIVSKPGVFSIDLIMDNMSTSTGKMYFYKGEQLISEGIEIYEYVIVN